MTHPGETAPGIPNGSRILCPLCDWWLDVPPPESSWARYGSVLTYEVRVMQTEALVRRHVETAHTRPIWSVPPGGGSERDCGA